MESLRHGCWNDCSGAVDLSFLPPLDEVNRQLVRTGRQGDGEPECEGFVVSRFAAVDVDLEIPIALGVDVGSHRDIARVLGPAGEEGLSLRELAATLPMVRRISTYNSDSNTPMVAVNEALGFRPAGRLSTWSRRLDAADLAG